MRTEQQTYAVAAASLLLTNAGSAQHVGTISKGYLHEAVQQICCYYRVAPKMAADTALCFLCAGALVQGAAS